MAFPPPLSSSPPMGALGSHVPSPPYQGSLRKLRNGGKAARSVACCCFKRGQWAFNRWGKLCTHYLLLRRMFIKSCSALASGISFCIEATSQVESLLKEKFAKREGKRRTIGGYYTVAGSL